MPAPSAITLTPNSGVAPFSVQITGTNLFERPSYTKKETFLVNAPDALPIGWRGTNPSRVDGVIGKGILCSPTGSRYLQGYSWGSSGTTMNGANHLWPNTTGNMTSIFVSLWIKPTTVTGSGIFWMGSGGSCYVSSDPYNMTYYNQIGFHLQPDGTLGFALVTYISGTRSKHVYTAPGAIVAGQWQHILGQWTSVSPGVSVDPPVIWINGVKQTTNIMLNYNYTDISYAANGTGPNGYTQIGYGPYGQPGYFPTTYSGGRFPSEYFNGIICDVYTGQAFLSDAQILMYANRPKVELIKV